MTKTPTVHHCPFCGETIGSFWAGRTPDGGQWCEHCQTFFRVTVITDDDDAPQGDE